MRNRRFIKPTKEYLEVDVTASVPLGDSVTVAFSLDRGATWLSAAWVGTEGLQRTAAHLLDTAGIGEDDYPVWVKLTDSPEVPIIKAGTISVV